MRLVDSTIIDFQEGSVFPLVVKSGTFSPTSQWQSQLLPHVATEVTTCIRKYDIILLRKKRIKMDMI